LKLLVTKYKGENLASLDFSMVTISAPAIR